MAHAATLSSTSPQIIVTLEADAMVADIKKALKLIRGVASVRMTTNSITPAVRHAMRKAREEYAKGETISCRTPEEMQQYFDNL